jgi:phage gp46-like protein
MDALINPLTRDYVPDTGSRSGELTVDPAHGLVNAAYLRLTVPLGSWFGDVTLGSKLHLLQREKDVARVFLLARQYSEAALKPMLDDGRLKSVAVRTEHPQAGWLSLAIEITDALGDRRAFKLPVKVV